jgi:hypothetical protein
MGAVFSSLRENSGNFRDFLSEVIANEIVWEQYQLILTASPGGLGNLSTTLTVEEVAALASQNPSSFPIEALLASEVAAALQQQSPSQEQPLQQLADDILLSLTSNLSQKAKPEVSFAPSLLQDFHFYKTLTDFSRFLFSKFLFAG